MEFIAIVLFYDNRFKDTTGKTDGVSKTVFKIKRLAIMTVLIIKNLNLEHV